MKCEICKARKNLTIRLDKIGKTKGVYERERVRTNVIHVSDPRVVIQKGLTEKLEDKEICPKCKSSLMDIAIKYDWEQKKWIAHKHVCSERHKCGWESQEFDGDFVEVV